MRPLSQCMRTVLISILLGCVFVASSAYGQSTTRDSMTYKERLLTAFGQSELRVQPDLAELRVGVETEASTADQAREENASRTNKVIGAIKALGIPERQIQTSMYQIEPVRRFPPGQQPPTTGLPPIVGYRVRNVVSVRTTNFQLIGRIIDNSIRAGANTVDGVQFMLQDERYIRERALQEAVAEARSNAQAMAKTLGLRLLMIHAVQQGAFGVVSPAGSYRALAAEAATPIMPGEITVNASATVTYVIR